MNSPFGSWTNDNFHILRPVCSKSFAGLLCETGIEFKTGDGAFWPDGVGPDHGRVA